MKVSEFFHWLKENTDYGDWDEKLQKEIEAMITPDCSDNAHNHCIAHEYQCSCPCHGFKLTKEEVQYLVKNIQNEYLNKETYYFARDLFNRMEKFLAENDELAKRAGRHTQ